MLLCDLLFAASHSWSFDDSLIGLGFESDWVALVRWRKALLWMDQHRKKHSRTVFGADK